MAPNSKTPDDLTHVKDQGFEQACPSFTNWVRSSRKERSHSLMCEGNGPFTFEDVAVHFSLEEWVLLNPDQKVLHVQIMEEIHGIVDSLGKALSLMGISISKCSIPVRTSLVGAIF
uniref:KRAB domain-containing protein n=1 Tax=Anolis carolinensis TaxID=28377 RepID=A0A803STQ5_ANOCA